MRIIDALCYWTGAALLFSIALAIIVALNAYAWKDIWKRRGVGDWKLFMSYSLWKTRHRKFDKKRLAAAMRLWADDVEEADSQ
jgi:hypothetical protein